jgi:hypothetical protein
MGNCLCLYLIGQKFQAGRAMGRIWEKNTLHGSELKVSFHKPGRKMVRMLMAEKQIVKVFEYIRTQPHVQEIFFTDFAEYMAGFMVYPVYEHANVFVFNKDTGIGNKGYCNGVPHIFRHVQTLEKLSAA